VNACLGAANGRRAPASALLATANAWHSSAGALPGAPDAGHASTSVLLGAADGCRASTSVLLAAANACRAATRTSVAAPNARRASKGALLGTANTLGTAAGVAPWRCAAAETTLGAMQRELPSVSDTARWVALFRARESERPDAVFRDPLAARLAGERGRAMARDIPAYINRNSWPIVARTYVIDELVRSSLAEGADRIVNLAAGFDTRPYRMALPPALRWIEADLPALLDDKEQALAGEKPVCEVVRERVDLGDAVARAELLGRALTGAKRALVITEGLLVYLDPAAVSALARDLAAQPSVAWWIADVASPGLLRMMQQQTGASLGASAQFRFGPEEGVAFPAAMGWRPREVRSLLKEAARLQRLPPLLRLFAWLPDARPDRPGRQPWSAVVRYGR
jgi:methyltransferase (TIGR00027 family)